MPAKDHYHVTVIHALTKDGWAIVQEQYKLTVGRRRLWVDIHAIKEEQQLAVLVEVKGFENSPSSIEELASAIGQYVLYRIALATTGVDIPLYLAIPQTAYDGIFSEPIGRNAINYIGMNIMVFSPEVEEIIAWFP